MKTYYQKSSIPGSFLIKSTTRIEKVITEIISTLLILLFTYAAVSKLTEYDIFMLQLGKSPFVTRYSSTIVWLIPGVELVIAALLIIKGTRMLALYASLFLMTLFSAYIYVMMLLSYELPCSCGGILSEMGWMEHLWFNIIFTVLSAVGIISCSRANAAIQ